MTFKTGSIKPAGSGMQPGTKTTKTKAREREHDEAEAEARLKASLYKGLSMEDMLDREDFDPRVYVIALIRAPNTNEGVKAKLLQMVMDKLYPSLKSVESKVDQVTRIEITGLPMPPEFVEVDAVVNETLTHVPDPVVSTDPALLRPDINND